MNIEEIFIRNPQGVRETLKNKTVGIAGCGGLGSNIAVSLVRAGIGNLIIVDYDVVDISNLNRQFFFLNDIGEFKVDAIRKYLTQINFQVKISGFNKELTPDNISDYFAGVDIMVEAFDLAEKKRWLIDNWLRKYSSIPLVCGSGLSGYGKTNDLGVMRAGNLFVCGDQSTDSIIDGLCSVRVSIVANMQANCVVEILMKEYNNDYNK